MIAAALGLKTAEALSIITELRDLGLDADVDLPSICVVGKQSSGKSSVMEALTGVPLPRANGTCTRCAFEISTKKDASKSSMFCKVAVRIKLAGNDAKERLDLTTTSDMSKVPEHMLLAQRLLLNMASFKDRLRDLRSGKFTFDMLDVMLPKNGENKVPFSSDVVVVEISGPDMPTLDLIDLPGLIQSVEPGQDEKLIPLISSLCAEYLKSPNTIVAMCCPFNDDMENQQVRMLARKHDSAGLRTVGVLTKADLLPEGTEEEWLAILRNDGYHTKHGYFAVRNLSQSEISAQLDADAARNKEEHFFSSTPQGQILQNAMPDRCGTTHLREFLGQKLCDLVREQLPALRSSLLAELRTAQNDLECLGAPVQKEDEKLRVSSIINDLAKTFSNAVEADGISGNLDYWHRVRNSYASLQQSCYDARPRFVAQAELLDDSDLVNGLQEVLVKISNWDEWHKLTDDLNNEGRLECDAEIDGKSLKKGMLCNIKSWVKYPTSRHNDLLEPKKDDPDDMIFCKADADLDTTWNQGWWNEGGNDMNESDEGVVHIIGIQMNRRCTYYRRPDELCCDEPRFPVSILFQSKARSVQSEKPMVSLKVVEKAIAEARGRELCLPGGPVAYRAAQQIVRAAQERWKDPADACVQEVRESLRELVEETCNDRLRQFPKLHKKITELLFASIDEVTTETRRWKDSLLDKQEGARDMFTQNDHYLKASFDEAQKRIRRILGCTVDASRLLPEEQAELVRLLSKAGKNLDELITLDPRDEAIWCMAAAYAYHKVVFKRFCDALPRAIDDLLLRGFVSRCATMLNMELGVLGLASPDLSDFLQEDAALEGKRKHLAAKADRLNRGLRKLDAALKINASSALEEDIVNPAKRAKLGA